MDRRVMFFFPYAGASSLTFQKWKLIFSPEIECILLDYPGHGIDEEDLCDNLIDIAKVMYKKVIEVVNDVEEYYLCGHCFGALVVYELYKLLYQNQVERLPKSIFLCSQVAPDKKISDGLLAMDDNKLCEYMLKNHLITEYVLQEEMKEYLDGIIIAPIRKDEYANDNYSTELPIEKYDVQVFVCYGEEDERVISDLNSWEKYFHEVQYIKFEGGHFFPWEDEELFADEMKDALEL